MKRFIDPDPILKSRDEAEKQRVEKKYPEPQTLLDRWNARRELRRLKRQYVFKSRVTARW